ncbi:conserved protein of unknown function [Petrocella atlantisensis]|uniref:Uncharacterized protein n=1 Tax=Petrocella atlantisensis TaxID=2173034 RepID=A0A3P7NUK9_9FIRM|nr:hypothetical protein [Petrocella atlantisensis]PKM55623.1 MAG: hypothetical protein CVV00_03205 [Firmicutes bacterium HGW-Firmicutes-5]VDN46834.1 conserved protein of unknown function [Petrocella atlantisensis]
MDKLKALYTPFLKLFDKIRLYLDKKNHIEESVVGGIDIDLDQLYEDPEIAKSLQQRYIKTMDDIEKLKEKYKAIINEITAMQRIELMSGRGKAELEKLCKVYSETLVKKGEFKDKISGQGLRTVDYLEQYEDQMDKIIDMMKGHEKNQSMVKQDLAYLESEKSELLYQNSRLKNAYKFVKNAFITVAILTALAAFILTIFFFVNKKPILLEAMISMVAIIVATVWVYIFRRYLVYEISKNQKMMKRTIELTNKTKIKYINNQSVIDYQCKKYRIDSSEMLELRWENYKNRMHAERQYKNISNSIAAMMSDIEDLLEKNGINEVDFILDHMDYFATEKGRKMLLEKYIIKKEELYLNLQKAERESGMMNLVLTNYKSHVSHEKGKEK